ncbi:MAG: exodeoxyribonuclease VII small subunit [Coriobacteriia bacterium]|nr:exodeoxyribonuclease VII small subunit [Coriobacteriia bacterium]
MSDPTCAAPSERSFGEALAELDKIVAQLEGGQLELEESMERYTRGVSLLKSLKAQLDDAQQKVTMLIGELEEETGVADAPAQTPSPAAPGLTSEEVPF